MERLNMIRPAETYDLDSIEETYREHFAHERAHGAYTVFREGVYPTRQTAECALKNGALFVYEESGTVLGSVILDNVQPEEYRKVDWPGHASDERVRVVHLLMVRPGAAGRGVGSALIHFALEAAKEQDCTAVCLDTGSQNTPAVSLYQKMGFEIAAASSMKVGGAIAHEGHLFLEKRL